MSKTKKLTQIKSSVFSRSLSLAKLSLNASFQYAAGKITNTPLEDFLNSQALNITKEFGELKGSVMKAGQMLSMYGEHFLPPEANKVLKTLQSDSPPIEWSTLRQYLSEYLDADVLDELSIEPESIGSASMGQVHLAVERATGQKIALKIQYPGVEKAIDSDVSALKKILSLAKVLPSGLDLTPVFEEIKTMLRQELDYEREAQQTIRYCELLAQDTRYVVPKVFKKYSNKKVLATEYIEGLKADHPLVQSLPLERRNRLAKNFIELYFREIFEWNFVQTDPHLGNYKIQIDSAGNDRLVLLDFGACKSFEGGFISHYHKMIKGAVTADEDLFLSGARGLGFVVESDSAEYIEAFQKFCYETVEPFWKPEDTRNKEGKIKPDGTYNWKQNDLPSRVFKKAIQFKNFDLRSPPQDILFLDRKTGGVFIFLSVLNAEINARNIIDPFLNKV
jgi:predicted unusual protein kinase regulating ubiquinone biosynthesis (AarF/ABC1/UbiB family)